MAKTFSVNGIVLKYFNYGEADKVFTFLSKEHGLIKAIAKGVKKSTSKLSGTLDLLNVNNINIRESRTFNVIIQSDNIISFPALRLDYDKLIYALYIGELILLFSNEGENAENIFDFVIHSLKRLEYSNDPIKIVLWFEMNYLKLLGYEPELDNCHICREDINKPNTSYGVLNPSRAGDGGGASESPQHHGLKSEVFYENKIQSKVFGFSLNTGSMICSKCFPYDKNYKIISEDMLSLFRLFKTINVENLENTNIDISKAEKIQELLKQYFSFISERKIKTLSVFEKSNINN